MRISALDHTLGHNPERHELVFRVDDRLAIVRRLDRLGIDYVDAGCPAADPSVRELFTRARQECHLAHARLVASLRLDAIRQSLETDAAVRFLLDAGTPVVALSGCGWHAGPLGLQEYCHRLGEAVSYLKSRGRCVIFRAEDFFDGYQADPHFALGILETAKASGADVLCLCDSAGGTLPHVMREICLEVRKRFEGTLGIRAQDESDLAVANTLEAVEQGFTHVEGSVNAYGPGGGSANLCSIIANLEYKLGHTVVGPDNLEGMPGVARFVADAGVPPPRRQTPPDDEALLHTVDVRLNRRLKSFERRFVIDRMRLLESLGYDLRTAPGTLELLVREALFPDLRPFEAERYEVTSHSALYGEAISTATATVRVGDAIRSESEQGAGPVDALERSLRQCLFALYPAIAAMHVTGYRVRPIGPIEGCAARVRVALDWFQSGSRWTTAGVSEDLTEAAWMALVDGFRLPLMRLGERGLVLMPAAADTSWAV